MSILGIFKFDVSEVVHWKNVKYYTSKLLEICCIAQHQVLITVMSMKRIDRGVPLIRRVLQAIFASRNSWYCLLLLFLAHKVGDWKHDCVLPIKVKTYQRRP
jgi:hypothetical protein